MPFPPAESLYADLCVLRDAPDPTDPQHDGRWRTVERWIAQAFPGGTNELEDARQEALVSVVRHVSSMRAESPAQAAAWIKRIVKHKRLDALRRRSHDPVRKGQMYEHGDRPALLDKVQAEDGSPLTPELIDAVVTAVLEQVHRALEESEPSPVTRQLKRAQAQATLLRLIGGADSDVIERALQYGEPIGKDRLYKWIERGRVAVELGLERWVRVDEEAADIVEALREIIGERRSDAGVPRPDRRKDRAEGGP